MNSTEKLKQSIAHLRAAHNVCLEMYADDLKADSSISSDDLLVIAALNRSFSLIEGFYCLVEANNPICALPLIRFQLDSALRLVAAGELSDGPTILNALLEGKPLSKVKGRDGRPLTDTRLYKHISAKAGYEWVGRVYKAVSGHIHFSSPHLIACVEGETRECWDEAVAAMEATTKLLLSVCGAWVTAKKQGAAWRQQPPTQ